MLDLIHLFMRAFCLSNLHPFESPSSKAFVQACFVLVDTADEEAMSKATTSGNVPLEEQVIAHQL